MSGLPIRVRVTAALAVAMAAVLAISGLFLYERLTTNLARGLDRELQQRAEDLASVVRTTGARLPLETGGRFVERGESYAQLLDRQGRVIAATKPLGGTRLLSRAALRSAQRRPLYSDHGALPGLNETSRLLATLVIRNRARYILVVGATAQNNAETLSGFRKELLIAGPAALFLAAVAGYLLAGLSLREVEKMRRHAAAISDRTVGERLPLPSTGDELQRLGETLNQMLDRLEAGLDRERDFVADAGHELRTPLALLRTELDVALRYGGPPEELREVLQTTSREIDRLTQLAEDLLLLAGSERGRLPLRAEPIDVAKLLDTVVTRFAWRAEREGRALQSEAEDRLQIVGDPLRLEQAVGNLVENALRHGRGAIRLSGVRTTDRVELHIRDEGDGLEPGIVDRAFDRFARTRREGEVSGHGLGLTIVRAIAEAHGGNAHFNHADDAGADFFIALPGHPGTLPGRMTASV